jgi:hypothetical protein
MAEAAACPVAVKTPRVSLSLPQTLVIASASSFKGTPPSCDLRFEQFHHLAMERLGLIVEGLRHSPQISDPAKLSDLPPNRTPT